MAPILHTLLPFLRWFPMTRQSLRVDVISGITVALVLVPQSMAYAMLAGLPVVYGLYAALLPVILGSLFGNFNLLHTGPVAMLSLMSLAAITPFAQGPEHFIELSIMLALMIGVLRLAMGVFRLGALVNLVSHPVIVGFTSAAALIIGLSQLRFLFNMPSPGTGSFTGDLLGILMRIENAHVLVVAFGIGTVLLIWGLMRFTPKLPAIMLAVVVGTAVSAAIGYEKNQKAGVDAIADTETQATIQAFGAASGEIKKRTAAIAYQVAEVKKAERAGVSAIKIARMEAEIEVLQTEASVLRKENGQRRMVLHGTEFVLAQGASGAAFYRQGQVPAGVQASEEVWRFQGLKDGKITMAAGGEVIGKIPEGLPNFKMPTMDWGLIWALLPAAFVMALIGFMEATSISKALAAKTRERIDTNKELVGQGIANIAGSFFQSYVVSGSFSRSAVGARSGARTGLYAVISALVVLVVLLFLTPTLYHLPQAVLGAIVMMAVFGLIRVQPLIQAWKVQRADAIAGIATFIATLAMAPAIANGILIGIALSVVVFLLRAMKPRAEVLGLRPDGTRGGVDTHVLEPVGENFVAMRFDRSLIFLNVAAFEDTVLKALNRYPKARAILVIGSGINEIDASGEEKVRDLVNRLREDGIALMFSSLKAPVAVVFQRAGLMDLLGADNVFASKDIAIDNARRRFDPAPAT
ncbi:MAG: STAS domain-containing protein [Sulfuriferula multivorans]|uniref:STAS domain-containing protein n=1 Tax=Sulfuriferula multivorans TaxID=1559896 RepID=A0A7C9JWY8_9PROT|nr:STAS domain-containing protein [Sulfuriferula multivorans]